MSDIRKAASLFLLVVLVVCGQVFVAASAQRNKFREDVPYEQKFLVTTSQDSVCKKPSLIRFQSIKIKNTEYKRYRTFWEVISGYASKHGTMLVNTFSECAEAAETGDFNVFVYYGGFCLRYVLDHGMCDCRMGGNFVVYVRDTSLNKKDLVLPKHTYLRYDELLSHAPISSAVFDQREHFADRLIIEMTPEEDFNDNQISLFTPNLEWLYHSVWRWNNSVFKMPIVDSDHCTLPCNVRSNVTFHQHFLSSVPGNYSSRTNYPFIYFLSECGKTISLDSMDTSSSDETFKRLLSHEGYGCQWYPKVGEDHECVLTFNSTNSSTTNVIIPSFVVDGNTTSCEGDILTIHNGTQKTDDLLYTFDPCYTQEPFNAYKQLIAPFTFVFKRSATQYQADGFNWGFNLFMIIDM